MSACSGGHTQTVDGLNDKSYAFHYRSLDSTRIYAERAYELAGNYADGRAEALNNLAFVSIAKMDYDRAKRQLDSISTDNIVELLVADVQHMRLCQRESQNKLFYDYREKAQRRLRRVEEEDGRLTDRQRRRVLYAQTEFAIIQSVYFYYVGLQEQSANALQTISPNGEIVRDTAQLLNYFYNIGSGGIISADTPDEVNDAEFGYLVRCYQLAKDEGYTFFEAQAMQGMAEHLENVTFRDRFVRENLPALALINPDEMPDSLLAGYLAQRALSLFETYGDVYQTAGAYRTLAECFWGINDYPSAEICLLNALQKDTAINRAPDLVASIREQLSLVYSAIDEKALSDHNRNLYLDMQEQTRQDRQLEARADQLKQSSRQLNLMIAAVLVMITLVLVMLYLFHHMRRRSDRQYSADTLLQPLKTWKQETLSRLKDMEERDEEIREQTELMRLHLTNNKRRNLEQRAKVSLACNILPFIDRIVNETKRLTGHDDDGIRNERLAYIAELTDKIVEYNDVLTRWIQMRQGEVSLRIESFPLQELFDMVKRGRMSFLLKGIDLDVQDTADVVKADKTLTLFMLNTMADNARKFTPEGGRVTISSQATDTYVEISVADTGVGMTPEQLSSVFSHQLHPVGAGCDRGAAYGTRGNGGTEVRGNGSTEVRGYGFGLMNCKGIIEKYKKVSSRFSVSEIGVESEPDKGSRFFFRLPKGVARIVLAFVMGTSLSVSAKTSTVQAAHPASSDALTHAAAYADSAYYSNIRGDFEKTMLFADSCRRCLNDHYLFIHPNGQVLMVDYTDATTLPPELVWLHDSIETNYSLILDIRNETAVAALALHQWQLYTYNNKVYTQLFRELSADRSLDSYCRMMQKSEQNKNVAIIILMVLLLSIFPSYYLLYYRHRLYYRYSVERVNRINRMLLSDLSAQEKLSQVEKLWTGRAVGTDPEHTALDEVVRQIGDALRSAIDAKDIRQTTIELAEDELHRVSFENDRLHISNNVLDNCLSALKHETMYYPSRIRQLLPMEDSAEDFSNQSLLALSEVAAYYKDLYEMLTTQAIHQTKGLLTLDADMLRYLFEILKKQGGEEPVVAADQPADAKYLRIEVVMSKAKWTSEECRLLFTPLTSNVDFLLCRQIIRDFGEITNARGCGIEVKEVLIQLPDSSTSQLLNSPVIVITLTKQIWNLLK